MWEVLHVSCQCPKQKLSFQLDAEEVQYCSLWERFLVQASFGHWVTWVQSCSILYLLYSA